MPLRVEGDVGVFGRGVQLQPGIRGAGAVGRLKVASIGSGARGGGWGVRDHAVFAAGAHAHVVGRAVLAQSADDALLLQVPGEDTAHGPAAVVDHGAGHEAPVATIGRGRTFGARGGDAGIGPVLLDLWAHVSHDADLVRPEVQLVDLHADAVARQEIQQVRIGGVPLWFGIARQSVGGASQVVQHPDEAAGGGIVQVPVAVAGGQQKVGVIGVEGLPAGIVVALGGGLGVRGIVGHTHDTAAIDGVLRAAQEGRTGIVG